MCYLQSAFTCCRTARQLFRRWKLKYLSEVDAVFSVLYKPYHSLMLESLQPSQRKASQVKNGNNVIGT